MLYALYGTPAESLCGLQIKQLRKFVEQNAPALENAGYELQERAKTM